MISSSLQEGSWLPVVEVTVAGSATLLEGRGGGNARALLPRGVEVKENDPVFAPSLGSRPVGVVGSIESDPSLAEQTIHVSLPVNLDSLRYVYVLN